MLSNIVHDNQPRRKTRLNGPILRYSPTLAAELGDAESLLLLQLDYWTETAGRFRPSVRRRSRSLAPCPAVRPAARSRWIRLSAADIRARAFTAWSIRKIQRLLKRLAERGLLHTRAFDAPRDATPYLCLDAPAITTLVYASLSPMITYVTPASPDLPPDPAPESLPRVKSDAHPRRFYRRPATKMTHPRDKNDAGIYIYKILDQEILDQEQERETSTRDNFDAPPTPPLFLSLLDPDPELIQKLADLAKLDPHISRVDLISAARQLAKGDYTAADLDRFEDYWYTHDWRGQKQSPPYLQQILQNIRKALDHTAPRENRFKLAAAEYNHRSSR